MNSEEINIIHIDLDDTIYENIMKEFLFYFLIFKFYRYNNKIFNYSYFNKDKLNIIIELPNTYLNYFEKYKILNYIPIEKKFILSDNIFPLIEENNINKIEESKIQIVSHILELFKENKIQSNNLDLSSKKYIKNEKCSKIINEALIKNIQILKNKYEYIPNFYQKNNFIKFLSFEFKKFCECFHLSTEVFYDKIIPNYFQNLRKNIIDSLINNSIYFTYSPFDKIINAKNEISNIIYNEEREKKYNDIFKELQDNQENIIINYEKIKPSILCFHDKGINFSIITANNKDILLSQLNKYMILLSRQFNEIKMIKTPLELEKEDNFLDELLNMINDNEKKNEIMKNIIKEKFDDYVFTIDNYIKMFFLLLRIRAGIPTILMGETGCGKTYLLRMFSLLYSKNLKNMWILKFNAGTTDKDIIDFINKTIVEINEIEEKEIKRLKEEFDNDYNNDKKEKDCIKRIKEEKEKNMCFLDKLWIIVIL